jgi:hypothetical protein
LIVIVETGIVIVDAEKVLPVKILSILHEKGIKLKPFWQ